MPDRYVFVGRHIVKWQRMEKDQWEGVSWCTTRRFHVHKMWMVQTLVWAGRRTGHIVSIQLEGHDHVLTLGPVSDNYGTQYERKASATVECASRRAKPWPICGAIR